MNIAIVGRGKVGHALHAALVADGTHHTTLHGKRLSPTALREANLVILAVPDGAIAKAASSVAKHLDAGAAVVHCAGARTTDELSACSAVGAAVGVMHPHVSFASVRHPPDLAGTTFVANGDPKALRIVREVARACASRFVKAETSNPTYHGAAAIAANGTAALGYFAVRLLVHLGFSQRNAEETVGGIVRTVGDNIANAGVPKALTGPVVRGDVDTVSRHRQAIRRTDRGALAAYEALLPVIIDTA
ncbi:MAG: DUF2520 domain-containing protein, partial [Myxococcota bacterium]